MSALVDLEQAALLHRAEDHWLRQCADRLRTARPRTARPRQAASAAPVAGLDEQEEVR